MGKQYFDEPYVSFVVAGRNDDYGGDFNIRLENSIRNLTFYANRFEVPIEFIIVNYNPLPEKKPLLDSLVWPDDRRYIRFRIVTVPNEVHQRFCDPEIREVVPLFEYIAKNIGIQRAKADFVCAANPDILYDRSLIEWLSTRPLEADAYYRVDRADFKGNPEFNDPDLWPDIQLARIRKQVFRLFMKGYTHLFKPMGFFHFRYEELKKHNEQKLYNKRQEEKVPPEFYFHCNCSGDFMLMHRDQWERLNGYPEETSAAVHTDALFVVVAGVAGIKEKVLPWCVYHQDHERRYTCDDDEPKPSITAMYDYFLQKGLEMIEKQEPMQYNSAGWGCAEEIFDEVEF